MEKFVKQSPIYLAEQWTGDNDKEFLDILNRCKFKEEFTIKRLTKIKTGREFLRITTIDFDADLEVGDWLVLDRNNELSSYCFHKFANGFHKVK